MSIRKGKLWGTTNRGQDVSQSRNSGKESSGEIKAAGEDGEWPRPQVANSGKVSVVGHFQEQFRSGKVEARWQGLRNHR